MGLPTPRIFIYFVLVASFILGGRPPTPKPSKDEKMKSFDLWDWLFINVQPLHIIAIFLCTLLEFTTLLLLQSPDLPTSGAILQQICPKQSEAALYIFSTKPVIILGPFLILAGGLLRRWCYRTLGRFFTFNLAILKGHKLIMSGPYVYVRHPSYAGGIMMCIGLLLHLYGSLSYLSVCGILGSPSWTLRLCAYVPGCLGLLTVAGMFRRCKTEDRMLLSNFGAKWDDYRRAVPHALIPGVL